MFLDDFYIFNRSWMFLQSLFVLWIMIEFLQHLIKLKIIVTFFLLYFSIKQYLSHSTIYFNSILLLSYPLILYSIIYIKYNLCLLVCPIITQVPGDRFGANFDWETWQNYKNLYDQVRVNGGSNYESPLGNAGFSN